MGKTDKREDLKRPPIIGYEFYLESFIEISSARASGMGISPIPFDKIYLWCEIYGVEFSMINLVVRAIDQEYLKQLALKEKVESVSHGQ